MHFDPKDMMRLSDRLLEVCNKMVEPMKSHTMDRICRGMARLTNGFVSFESRNTAVRELCCFGMA